MDTVTFDFIKSHPEKVSKLRIVHGVDVIFERGQGPFQATRHDWERIIRPTGYFEEVIELEPIKQPAAHEPKIEGGY